MSRKRTKRVMRLDSQPLNQTFFTPEGYLMDRPILTSTGIFEYTNPDGTIRRELRLPEEVFDPESLKSYRGRPIIVTHDAGLITKNNVADEQIGTILSEGYRSGDDVRAEIVIHDTDELKDSGYRELSLGYNLDLDETPGVYEGEPYDAIQRNIRINHLALVNEARAGDQARLNIDGRDKALKGGKLMKKTKTKKRRTVRVDSILSPEELKKAIEEYKARRANCPVSQADDDEEPIVTTAAPKPVVATNACADDEEAVVIVPTDPAEIEETVQVVKDRKDRRDEEEDPANLREANVVIDEQDHDIQILFDIIDTLLAQIAFDDGEEETTEPSPAPLVPSDEETFSEDDDDECAEETLTILDDEDVILTENEDDDDDEETVFVENEDDDEETVFVENEDDDEEFSDEEALIPAGTALNADSIDRIVRERVKIAKAASALNMDGLESIKPMKAKRTIIRIVKPGIRLDGKSNAYINAMFDLACQEIQKRSRKGTAYQRKQMFNKDGRSASKNTTEAARQKMIKRMQKSK